MKSILITGVAGYIGSALADVLLKKGYTVTGIDNFSTGKTSRLDKLDGYNKFSFFNIDMVNQPEELDRLMLLNEIDTVMHFASFTSVPDGELYSLEYYRNNLISTMNLLDSMENHSIKDLYFTSTAAVYKSNNYPVNENWETNPLSVYGKSKLMIEDILKDCRNSKILGKLTIFRFFNVAGAYNNMVPNFESTSLIPSLVNKSKSGEVFYQYGNNLDTKDGSCYRDFIHVYDLVNAIVTILENGPEDTYNIGTGKAISINEVIDAFER